MTPTAEGTPSDTATPSPTVTSSPTAIGGCPVISSETYSTLSVNPPPTDRPAAQHADLNLALRSYIGTTGYLGLVDISGPTDSNAPQLYNLFGDKRTGVFTSLSQVYDWNWATNSRGAPITDPAVTLARLAMAVGEAVHVPGSGYTIGTPSLIPAPGTAFLKTDLLAAAGGYEVLVLYAATNRITLKYTRDDNVIHGYTLHVEDVCVEPRLLALYQQMNTAGRANLPALRAGQSFGTARTTSIGAAIRDSGSFMEPRSRKDWWQGR
jgi:hypothetical protein